MVHPIKPTRHIAPHIASIRLNTEIVRLSTEVLLFMLFPLCVQASCVELCVYEAPHYRMAFAVMRNE